MQLERARRAGSRRSILMRTNNLLRRPPSMSIDSFIVTKVVVVVVAPAGHAGGGGGATTLPPAKTAPKYGVSSLLVLLVEPKVDERIVAHRADAEPMAEGVDGLGVHRVRNEVQIEEVEIERQPTDGEHDHNEDEHLQRATFRLQVRVLLRAGHRSDARPFPDVNAYLTVAKG